MADKTGSPLNYKKEGFFKNLVEELPAFVFEISGTLNITYANNYAANRTGWERKELIGKKITDVMITVDKTGLDAQREKLFHSDNKKAAKYTVKIKSGKEFRAFIKTDVINDKNGKIIGYRIIGIEIDKAKEVKKKLSYSGIHDKLTGLYNRSYFIREFNRVDSEDNYPLSMIMGDINGLKRINEKYGNEAGNSVIRKTGKLFKAVTRQNDIVCRYGDGQFVILLPQTNIEITEDIIMRIRSVVEASKILKIPFSISLGSATKQDRSKPSQGLLKEAEDSMYKNKLLRKESIDSSLINALERALFERSDETRGHTERLKKLAIVLGKSLNLSQNVIDDLIILASLHDIGKVGIPDEILNKKGKLNPEEWKVMKKHSEIGYNIAKTAPRIENIANAILAHHENWDGSGYPNGLKREEIPLISRVSIIIDAYDAMTHDRPYKKAMGKEEAVKEIKNSSGKQFDPRIVRYFIKIVEM